MPETSLFPRVPRRRDSRPTVRRSRPSAGYTDPFFADPAEVEDDYRRLRRD